MSSLTATEIYTGGSDTKVALRWAGIASTYRVWMREGVGSAHRYRIGEW